VGSQEGQNNERKTTIMRTKLVKRIGSARQWWQLLRGTKRVVLHESEFVSISPAQLAQF
jgi:hypothetical protein